LLFNPTYQMTGRNRIGTTLTRQVYDKINRGADSSNGTQDPRSVWHEHDILAVYQGLWNFVINDRQFVDTRVSYNSINFPLNLKTNLQTLLDSSTNIRTRANTIQQIMDRRRLEVSSNWQYFVPNAVGGRHEFRVGFGNAYTPERVDLSINENVRDTYRTQPSAQGAPAGPVSVQLFNTPLIQKRAVMITSLYGQDTYTYKHLTAVGGIRWERVEGWLPAQQDPPSQYFGDGTVITPTFTAQRSFPEVRDVPLWHNAGPRGSIIYDLRGDGRTAIKASLARYYDQIGTGTPGGANPNGLVSQTYIWNDNGDLVFQPGELGAPSGSPSLPATLAQLQSRFQLHKRPYRNELTVGVDHQLARDLSASVTYIQRHEHDQIATIEQNIPFDYYTPIVVADPSPDGKTGTADDTTLTVYNENLPVVPSVTGPGNDNRVDQRYKGVEATVSKRFSNRWTLLGGYTFSRTLVDATSVTSPNSFVNSSGRASIDRAHNFKVTGSYLLPWDVQVGGNFRAQSGQPFTRTLLVTGLNQNPTNGVTVNAEPRGKYLLPSITTVDLRVGKIFRLHSNVFEADIDVYNLTNSNAVYNVRNTTGRQNVTDFTTGQPVSIQQFNSPTGVLGPRIIRVNVSYRFGQ
jgi:hypothetical protein